MIVRLLMCLTAFVFCNYGYAVEDGADSNYVAEVGLSTNPWCLIVAEPMGSIYCSHFLQGTVMNRDRSWYVSLFGTFPFGTEISGENESFEKDVQTGSMGSLLAGRRWAFSSVEAGIGLGYFSGIWERTLTKGTSETDEVSSSNLNGLQLRLDVSTEIAQVGTAVIRLSLEENVYFVGGSSGDALDQKTIVTLPSPGFALVMPF